MASWSFCASDLVWTSRRKLGSWPSLEVFGFLSDQLMGIVVVSDVLTTAPQDREAPSVLNPGLHAVLC